jgi:hypothetical protein
VNILYSLAAITYVPLWAIWLVAIIVLVLAAGRMTRLIYHDDFPPTIWLRTKWDLLTEDSSWNLLLHCPWCLGFWATVGFSSWFAVGLAVEWVMVAWWIVAGMLALGYIVPMIVARDEPSDSE